MEKSEFASAWLEIEDVDRLLAEPLDACFDRPRHRAPDIPKILPAQPDLGANPQAAAGVEVAEHGASRFGGFTIPIRLRVGYFVGTDRVESDGEFFRATIDVAAYR